MHAEKLTAMPISSLTGVGEKMAQKLEKLGLYSVHDLLFHFPHRYEDRTNISAISSLMPGQFATIQAKILSTHISHGKRSMLTVKVSDKTATLTLRFFNFTAAMHNRFNQETQLYAYGEIKAGHTGLEIIHPECNVFSGDAPELSASLTPVYPATEGVKQLLLRNLSEQALDLLTKAKLPELLPEKLNNNPYQFTEAIKLIHRPTAEVSLIELEHGEHPAQQRLIIEELVAQNLSMLAVRSKLRQDDSYILPVSSKLKPALLASLPFSPTNAQQRVVADIEQDLQQQKPMMRLVQGDVGSGKTLVAALAALQAIEQGFQVALMAPTEILAEQHALNFTAWLAPLGIDVAWLGGKLTGKNKQKQLDNISSGSAKMVVGTHALFQKTVEFHQLALVIIDEQHRFGVHQRLALREKGSQQGKLPHQLIMTATPIPRTLAMTAYADLDTSIIDELPPGRTPINTVAVPDTRHDEIVQRVHAACLEGRQAYWVCTLIDESEAVEAKAAADAAAALTQALPDLNIGLVHGRMKPAEKQLVMDEFKQGKLHVMVATTVIEVGVDVPNASLMIIENPERLGLAQLHQLRGRVGRGKIASHCVLLYHAPLSKTAGLRLSVLRDSSDGFVIAERDLEIRGPGELLGTKQTGLVEFKIADLVRDQHVIADVQKIAGYIHNHYPDNAKAIIERWLGSAEHFTNA